MLENVKKEKKNPSLMLYLVLFVSTRPSFMEGKKGSFLSPATPGTEISAQEVKNMMAT